MFQVLVELQYVDVNPARQVRDLSEKTSERQIYISYKDYCRIIDLVPKVAEAHNSNRILHGHAPRGDHEPKRKRR